MATIDVKDAAGATQTLERPLAPGQAAMAASRPVVIASNQSAVPVSGTVAVSAVSGTSTVSGTVAATQSGTWTVQPGNTANTTAWKVDGSAVTQPISGAVTQSGTWTVQPGNTANTTAWLMKLDPTQVVALGQTTGSGSQPVVLPNDYGVPLATDKMVAGTTSLTPKFATIAVSSSGDNSIVASVSSKKIRVLSLKLTTNGAVNAKWRSATTDITGLSYLAAAGDGEVLPFNPLGWFETAVTSALQVNLSAAVAVGGHLTYVEV
jgi:hypothetical protein